MRIEKHRYVNINMVDCDVDAMRRIIELACAHLNNSAITHMRGVPIPQQAGLVGSDLISTREMIEEIGFAVGAEVSLKDLSLLSTNDVSPLDKQHSLVEVA